MGYTRGAKLIIKKMVLQDTGTYNQQVARPYNTNMDARTLDVLVSKVEQSPNNRMVGSMLAGIAGSFIRPQSDAEANVGIANGWDTNRIRFLMEVECHQTVGSINTQYIQGYTNFSGITNAGSIAPDMVFYINSIIETRRMPVQTPTGYTYYENVSDNSHVMSAADNSNVYQPNSQHLMRPQDVFLKMSTNHLTDANGNSIAGNLLDSRIKLRKDAQKSSRKNSMAATYAASIIDSYSQATNLTEFNVDETTMIQSAMGYVVEKEASVDPFLSAISQVSSNIATNTFTFEDIVAIDPNVKNIINYVKQPPTMRVSTHSVGQTANWTGTDIVTVSATILSQAVPSIMMDLTLNKVVFKSTNHDLNGRPNTVLVSGKGFSNNTDLTRNYQGFIFRLENEVLKDLTYNFSFPYRLEMTVDLFGETWISVEIGDSGMTDFVTPSFCDNLFVPVVTTNITTLNQLSTDFQNLSETIKDMTNQSFNPASAISTLV